MKYDKPSDKPFGDPVSVNWNDQKIILQSTPKDENYFYHHQMKVRAFGRRFSQLSMIVHHFRTRPNIKLRMLYKDEATRESFLKFAEQNNVKLIAGEVEKFSDMVAQMVTGIEILPARKR